MSICPNCGSQNNDIRRCANCQWPLSDEEIAAQEKFIFSFWSILKTLPGVLISVSLGYGLFLLYWKLAEDYGPFIVNDLFLMVTMYFILSLIFAVLLPKKSTVLYGFAFGVGPAVIFNIFERSIIDGLSFLGLAIFSASGSWVGNKLRERFLVGNES